MKPRIKPLIASLTVGMFVPVIYIKNSSGYVGWMVFGLLVGLACYVLVHFALSKWHAKSGSKDFMTEILFHMCHFIAPLFAYLVMFLIIKEVAQR